MFLKWHKGNAKNSLHFASIQALAENMTPTSLKSSRCAERMSNTYPCIESSNSHMVNVLGTIESVFAQAIRKAFPHIEEVNVNIQLSKIADYQCNAAMSLAKVNDITTY